MNTTMLGKGLEEVVLEESSARMRFSFALHRSSQKLRRSKSSLEVKSPGLS